MLDATDPATVPVKKRETQQITNRTATKEVLANARADVERFGLDKYLIIDVDCHHTELSNWARVLGYIDDVVLRRDALYMNEMRPGALINAPVGLYYQEVGGRIPHSSQTSWEPMDDECGRLRDVVALERSMDMMGIDLQVVFPEALLQIGTHPQTDVEVLVTKAYTRYLVEEVLPSSNRLKSLVPLPFADPKACVEAVEKYADHPDVVGFMIASQRHQGVQQPEYMPLYDLIQDTGLPLAFHAGPTFLDSWGKQLNKFISVHSVSFVMCNIVHMTSWIYNGIPERFPRLKTIWVESGLAWVPFLMQRLDSEYMMRQSDAPLLKKLPSEYIKEMYFTSQPMEATNLTALEMTMKIMDAENTLLYASDWPHWDFDAPSRIVTLPFLSEEGKRKILGENARRVFKKL